jgi:integrase
MSYLKIEQINLKNQTIFIPGDIAKNHKDAIVTLPAKVITLMIELNVFTYPGNFFLFGNGFTPSKEWRDNKQFRDFWDRKVRKELNFKSEYKFYSLKDTGITNMLKKYDTITVRDQARHADILMTDTYTPHDLQEANDLIKNHDGNF